METIFAFVLAIPAILALSLKAGVVVGLFGSLLEEIGKRFSLFRLIAIGQQIEAIAVDVPKLVSRVQGWDLPGLLARFRKAPTALLVCLALAGSAPLTGCTNVKPALTSAQQVPKGVALGLEAAGTALAVADTITAAYLDSLKSPTDQQIADAQAIVNTLQDVKDSLDLVRADMTNGRARLREALDKLVLSEMSLERMGVKLPASVGNALSTLAGVLQ